MTETHTNRSIDPSQDPSSLYFLPPSDNPGMKLVSFKFDGNGYNDWPSLMKQILAIRHGNDVIA